MVTSSINDPKVIVNMLEKKFPFVDWKFREGLGGKTEIVCNNWELYKKNNLFRQFLKILRKKFVDIRFYVVYQSF